MAITLFPNALGTSLANMFPRNAIAALVRNMPRSPIQLNEIYPEDEIPGFHVVYNIYSGGRPMAPIVSVNSAAVLLQPNDHYKLTADPLVIKTGIVLTPEDIVKLALPQDPTKPYVDQLKLDYAAHIKAAVERRKFWAISEILMKGRIFYVGGVQNPVKVYLNFDLLPTHKRAVSSGIAAAWGTDEADPFSDIVTAANLIDDDGGAPATHIVMNRNTLLLATNSKKLHDTLVQTHVSTQEFDQISRFKVMLKGMGLELFIVNESYLVPGVGNHKFVEDGRVAVFSLTGNDAGDPNEMFGQTILTSSVDAEMEVSGEFSPGFWSDFIESKNPRQFLNTGGLSFLPVTRYPDRQVCMFVTGNDAAAGWGTPTL